MQLKTIPDDFVVVEIAHHEIREEGPYALLELTKRNTTTEKALAALADSLGVPRRFLGYAGVKDARALTRQFVTVKIENPAVVERIRRFRRDNVTVRMLGYRDEPLGIGQLEQNRFEIVCRRLTEQMHPLQHIPNYFDEQRFSSANAEIGKLLIHGDYVKAAQRIAQTDDEADAKISEYLSRRENDGVGALRLMPKNILLMYVHAYQSLLWNEVLTRYIRSMDPDAVLVDGPVQILVPLKDLEIVEIPIFGFGTEEHPLFGKWYEEILQREDLEPRDFVVRALPFLAVEGDMRAAFFKLSDLEVGEREPDNLNPGFEKQRLSFVLPKACYATMAVKVLYRTGRVLGER